MADAKTRSASAARDSFRSGAVLYYPIKRAKLFFGMKRKICATMHGARRLLVNQIKYSSSPFPPSLLSLPLFHIAAAFGSYHPLESYILI